jgi:hypothetical protein
MTNSANRDILSLIDKISFSTEDKLNLYHNIKDILSIEASVDQKSLILVEKIQDFFHSKIEELKEIEELKLEGQFNSNSTKPSFKRIV